MIHRHFPELDSTNAEALRWCRDGAPHGAFVSADSQTAGRGRRGRDWSSPPGKGLYCSVVMRLGADAEFAPRLNFAACLGAVHALHEMTCLTFRTKWPNDVLIQDRKIAGVLSEAEFRDGQLDCVVVGIGINVNFAAHELPERPVYPATSLLLETGREWPVEALREAWLHDFKVFYTRLLHGDWPQVRDEFWQRCAQRNQVVTVENEGETVSGTAFALGLDGALLLETPGGIRRVLAGDVI